MNLLYFSPYWGFENIPFNKFTKKVKSTGYNGLELAMVPGDDGLNASRVAQLQKDDLLFIGQPVSPAESDFKLHKAQYEARLREVAKYNPMFINAQTGKDYFSFEQNLELLALAAEVSEETGVKMTHETHRGKFSYSAMVTQVYFSAYPHFRLCADFSHWCCVSESLLEQQDEIVQTAVNRSDHIHARVGYEEGIQVPHPGDKTYAPALKAHMKWWQHIVDVSIRENREYLTITPEFGPPPYMPLMAHTARPVADQWEVNEYMLQLLREKLLK